MQGPDYDLRTTAVYLIESHESAHTHSARRAQWVRAKVGDERVSQVEQLPKAAGYRMLFPERDGTAPIVVASSTRSTPPTLRVPGSLPGLRTARLVQQTLWEVRVPWGRAVVGVPAGWTDENTWAWDGYFFRRRPWRTAAALAVWASGSKSGPSITAGLDDGAAVDTQSYVFGRPGPPSELHVSIASRGWLVGICSGSVLAMGAVLILYWSPPPRLACGTLLAAGLMCGTFLEPSVTFLAVQSAMIGVALTILTALMHFFVHRRSPAPVFGDLGGRSSNLQSSSSMSRPLGVGSDDSTEIRVRSVASTVDHQGTEVPWTPDGGSADGHSPRVEGATLEGDHLSRRTVEP